MLRAYLEGQSCCLPAAGSSLRGDSRPSHAAAAAIQLPSPASSR